MKIGIYVDDANLTNIDISLPEYGNPGVGGTQICFSLLLSYLESTSRYTIYFYHNNITAIWPKTNFVKVVTDVYEAVKAASQDGCDIFLFRYGIEPESLYDLIDKMQIKSIGWSHNFIGYKEMEILARHEYFKRLVFVGEPQYQRLLDCKAIGKCVVIPNFYCEKADDSKKPLNFVPGHHDVVYSGALTPLKGFAILAKCWKKILKKVPDARLLVIGTGKLYNKKIKLGPYNIAEKNYEKSFIKYLTNKDGKIIESVKFLGILGLDKHYIYSHAKVGIVNPKGTETLCLVALEMQNFRLPVVSKNKNGTIFSVKDKSTGILFRTKHGLIKSIVSLLTNKKLQTQMSKNAKAFVSKEFSTSEIGSLWDELFLNVTSSANKTNTFHMNNHRCSSLLARFSLANLKTKRIFCFGKPVTYYLGFLKKKI